MNSLLRPLLPEDLSQIRRWRNHESIRSVMFSTHEISEDEHRAWYEREHVASNRRLLVYQVGAHPMGFINFKYNAASRNGEWGFFSAPDAPAGTGTAMGRSALIYAFDELGLHKVSGEVLDINSRSIKFHVKLGFTKEGQLRKHHFDGTTYHDVHLFGLLKSDWKNHLATY